MTAMLSGMFNSAPDTPSPIYPDRLIRPLPKRTLRSRLSSDAADSILYPPAPPATQLFYGACATTGEVVNDSKVYVQQSDGRDPSSDGEHLPYDNGVDLDSGEEDGPVVVRRSAGFRGSSLSPSTSSVQPQPLPSNGKEPQPVKLSSTGPDGYDAFENTNNKKKRKIPTPGNLGSHHSALSPEFSNMGVTNSAQSPSGPSGEGGHVSTFYGTGSPASPAGSGISGAGRGRLGRHQARGNPGRPSMSVYGPITWPHNRNPSRRDGPMSSPGPTGDAAGTTNQGIISAAIASAAASAFSSPHGPNPSSMLEQQVTTPTKTQFTFTCESDSSKGMALQTQNPYPTQQRSPSGPHTPAQGSRGFATHGTQTSPNIASHLSQQGNLQQQQQSHLPQQPAPSTEPTTTVGKKKRSPGSIYALAARQRKIQQQYANLHHPPSLEDIWICEFCEYESIFGHPPEALIRQYEIKDRKERKRLAEKKRLLEKAKMKGRKNKKTTKNTSKNATAQQTTYDHGYDRTSIEHSSLGGGHGSHDDEYPGGEYDDEAGTVPPSAPSGTFKPPLPPGSQSKKVTTTMTGSKGTIEGAMKPP